MNFIKITVMAKRADFHEIKEYKKHASERIVVRKYSTGISRLVVDEER